MLVSMICSKVLQLYQLVSVSVIPKIQCRHLSRQKGSDISCEGRGAGLQMQLKIALLQVSGDSGQIWCFLAAGGEPGRGERAGAGAARPGGGAGQAL